MPKFTYSIATALMIASATAIAVTPTPVPMTYSNFTLTDAEVAQMPNSADKACKTKADKTPNPNAEIACNEITYRRIDKRLNASYRKTMARLPKAKQSELRLEEKQWLETRFNVCEQQFAEELNVTSVSYRQVVSNCRLAELYRRVIWIERYKN
jgi:uncharacterized protein YecT (DUF1311 family)